MFRFGNEALASMGGKGGIVSLSLSLRARKSVDVSGWVGSLEVGMKEWWEQSWGSSR